MFVMGLLAAPLPLGLMGWFVIAAPTFAKMFADFGGTLPWITHLALQRWWGPVMAAGYLLALPLALIAKRTIARDFILVSVVVAGLMLVMASVAAMYLPIFQLAEIR